MITVGYSTRKSNTYFKDLIKSTSGFKEIQIIEKVNNGEKSLSKTYNEILQEAENDIVILCHDDILFEKPYWGKRVVEHFEKSDFGILGVAGTKYLPSSGKWWEVQSEMIGQVYHQHEGKKWLSEYNKPFGSKIIDTIIVDGLFIGIHKKRIKKNFDEKFDGFHFYDVSFCFSNFLDGVKVGVMSNIPLTHLSIGMTNEKWEKNRIQFSNTYSKNLPQILKYELPELKLNDRFPIVSIITPIFNYGKMFQKTLNSVFESTYKNIELIVVCDGSTDEYVLLKLKTLESHPNIKIIYQNNTGPSSARNNGVKNSVGEYILPLDSDDLIHPEYIQSCLNVIKQNNKISPVYCDTYHIGEVQGIEQRPEWSMERLKQGPFIVNCSMFRKEAFEKCEGYDTSLFGWEDYDLWIRMGLNGYFGKKIPKPLFYYFHHEKDGTVSTEANKNQTELYKKIIGKNFKMINLYTSYFISNDELRQKEIDFCLEQNIKNENINKIYILSEEPTIPFNSTKIELIYHPRPTFKDFFTVINENTLEDEINIISNSDIFFDDTVLLTHQFLDKNTVICLLRWEFNDNPRIQIMRADCQDSWMWIGKIKDLDYSDFYLGKNGCDNRIAWEFKNKGYNLINPCTKIKTYHFHESNVRTYISDSAIQGPYQFINPF